MFVVLNRIPGCTGDAVAEALARRYGASGALHIPDPAEAPSDFGEICRHVRDRVFTEREWGREDTVAVGCFHAPRDLFQLRRLTSEVDPWTHAFRLVHTREQASRHCDLGPQELRDLFARLTQGELAGDLGTPIEADALDAEQLAKWIWDELHGEIRIVAADPAWPELFARERARLVGTLAGLARCVEHIGSTAVLDLAAKPIIDIAVGVARLDDHRDCIPLMKSLGYTFADHPQNVDRKVFSRREPGVHVHVMEDGGSALARHLRFRDLLRDHRERRVAYAALKRELAAACTSRAEYTDRKSVFIEETLLDEAPAPDDGARHGTAGP